MKDPVIAPQEDATAAAEIAAGIVPMDEWALQEARILQEVFAAGCSLQEAVWCITGDDLGMLSMEVM